MKKDEKSLNKGDIIQAVRAKGFSARKAAKAVNAVFDLWRFALWCGDEVEVPGGILQAKITKGKEQMSVIEFQDVNTKEPIIRTVRYPGRRRVVKLKPDPELVVVVDSPPPPSPPPPPPPPPPKKETSEEVEERQLVTDLLKLDKPADDKTMLTIREAVGLTRAYLGDGCRINRGHCCAGYASSRPRGVGFTSLFTWPRRSPNTTGCNSRKDINPYAPKDRVFHRESVALPCRVSAPPGRILWTGVPGLALCREYRTLAD